MREKAVQAWQAHQAQGVELTQRVETAVRTVLQRDPHYEDLHYLEALSRVWQALAAGRADANSGELGRVGSLETCLREAVFEYLLGRKDLSREDAGLLLYCYWEYVKGKLDMQNEPTSFLRHLGKADGASPVEERLILTPAEIRRMARAKREQHSGSGR